jgi:serine O-acetyltransferase
MARGKFRLAMASWDGGLIGKSSPRSSHPLSGNHMLDLIREDLRQKALWCYENDRWPMLVKTLLTDGTMAMIIYRLMQWSHQRHLVPLEMVFNKLNAVFCNCIIGRGAEFGSGFVLIHSTGVVINSKVRGGRNVLIEHQVTIGAERRLAPTIGDGVFLGAGAKILGAVVVGDGARVGANAVVVKDVPPHCTVVGIPARVVRDRTPAPSDEGYLVDERFHDDAPSHVPAPSLDRATSWTNS